ncbi:retinol dehydrogenase 14-like isoform X3 [Hyperolius riggenbachi]
MNVRFWHLNLANLQSIRNFCRDFLKSEKRLDILINNDAHRLSNLVDAIRALKPLEFGSRQARRKCMSYGNTKLHNISGVPAVLDWTDNGFSMCFGVNHLGPFLLTNLLLDRLKSCPPSRIVNITSNVYKYQKLDFTDLNYNIIPLFTYCRSKLANVYFTQELARQGEKNGISCCAVNTGPVVGDWTSRFSILFRIVMYVFTSMFFISCQAAAQTVIFCAISDDILQHNGGYFSDCKPCKLSPHVQDAGIAKKLWEASEVMVGLTSSPREHLASRTR